MLIDSHAHISDEKFDSDRLEVIRRALNNDVKYIIEVGCDPNEWDKVSEISKEENIFSMFGIHPHDSINLKYCCKIKNV